MASMQSQIVELLPKLRRFAYSLTGNVSDGDDLLQNSIERALKRQETFDTEKRLESWMFTIIKNIWIDELRSRSRRGISVDIDERYELTAMDGRVVAEQKLMTEKVLKAMAMLPDKQHKVAYRVLVEGDSYKEAAAYLDLPIGTVMSSLSRARQSLSDTILGRGLLQ